MRIGIVILRCVIASILFGVIGFFVMPVIVGHTVGSVDNSGLDSWAWAFQGLMFGAFIGLVAALIYSFVRRRGL